MKGQLKRFRDRQKKAWVQTYSNSMAIYVHTLKALTEAVGDGKDHRQDERPLVQRLKPNDVYAVICPDNENYYRTVMIKTVPMTGGFQTFISNPVYGEVPDQMQMVDQSQVFKQMREMNASMSMTTMDAFPHQGINGSTYRGGDAGIRGTGVNDLHLRQQKRGLL